MTTTHLTTGIWAAVQDGCPLRCGVEGSDMANLIIGEDGGIELQLDATTMRRLAEVSAQAVSEMDVLYERGR
ncbi:hypothetical protein [Actinophytocola gossypii]|uniref:DUF397 domain-containing protein n=1 Tax=Actinophytocola gossypii TaxID=2812003 RepID=A0ABT2J8G8_9PSEU|nr:hypothetical protein [Actinophytocola gossypii]MCT2584152.1 hypothetical protein [Actinophytocola gossypii]